MPPATPAPPRPLSRSILEAGVQLFSRSVGAMSSDAGAAAARAFIEAELEPFDDGFVPSACADGMRMPTRLLRPPQPKALRRGLTVLPEAISEEAAHAAYDFTVARTGEERQWGTYFRLVGGGDGATGLQLEARGVEPEVERIAQR